MNELGKTLAGFALRQLAKENVAITFELTEEQMSERTTPIEIGTELDGIYDGIPVAWRVTDVQHVGCEYIIKVVAEY